MKLFKTILMTTLVISQSVALKAQNPAQVNYDSWPVPVGPINEMTPTSDGAYFTLWSPKATAAEVIIRWEGMDRQTRVNMHRSTYGRWTCHPVFPTEEAYYSFRIKDRDGKWHEETPGIFAKAVSVNGKYAAIVDMQKTNPEGWENDVRPEFDGRQMSDAVIYEMHHRDFSIDPESGIQNRGKYLALTEHGTTCQGQKTGIDHLVELGVTHVHLLPSYDYGSVDETRLDVPQYNWGYDPVNYNVPEGSYSTDPTDPATRIREFKQMVQALHKAGIRVVMDVVYNHVFDLGSSNFERTAPGYFFRWNADGTPANGSGCGNETASDRPMMRKFMVESVLYWAKEYHIDGFRFDLMGIHDIETMNEIREALNAVDPSIIIYGEGWAAASPALSTDRLAMKANVGQMPGIAAFGDEMRDGLRGPWDGDEKGAFLIGKTGNEESVKFGLAGAVRRDDIDMQKVNYSDEAWANSPSQMISYVSCHDDMCLADRIKATAPKADKAERVRLQKLGYTAVMTSAGVPFIWCGDEIMRDRKGVHNCYNSPDSINTIPWAQKAKYRDVFDYIRGLIQLRKYVHHDRPVKFLPVKMANVIAYSESYIIDDSQIVILNSNRKTITQEIPEGEWVVVACDGLVNLDGMGIVKGGKVRVSKQSAVILRRSEDYVSQRCSTWH